MKNLYSLYLEVKKELDEDALMAAVNQPSLDVQASGSSNAIDDVFSGKTSEVEDHGLCVKDVLGDYNSIKKSGFMNKDNKVLPKPLGKIMKRTDLEESELEETEEILEDGPVPEEVKDSLFNTPKKVEKDPETGLTKVTVA